MLLVAEKFSDCDELEYDGGHDSSVDGLTMRKLRVQAWIDYFRALGHSEEVLRAQIAQRQAEIHRRAGLRLRRTHDLSQVAAFYVLEDHHEPAVVAVEPQIVGDIRVRHFLEAGLQHGVIDQIVDQRCLGLFGQRHFDYDAPARLRLVLDQHSSAEGARPDDLDLLEPLEFIGRHEVRPLQKS